VLVFETDLVEEAPIIDLRVRKARRRHGATVVVASSHPTTLDANADHAIRFPPGGAEAALQELAEPDPRGGGPVVIIWGERLAHGARGRQGVAALLALARKLDLQATEGAGLIEIPAGTNGRGLREVGCLPNLGPGLTDASASGKGADEIRDALGEELKALVLLHTDPLETHPGRRAWGEALERAGFVVAFTDHVTPGIENADVVFPAASYAEKEGTMTHPDGRVQRVRQAIGHPGEVRQPALVLAELCSRLGTQVDASTTPMVTQQVADAVPFYAGLTLDEIGGRGVRWQERDAASGFGETPKIEPAELEAPPAAPSPNGALRLGTFRPIWSAPEVDVSPSLKFLAPHQRVELSPQDAERLGLSSGDRVEVAHGGTAISAEVIVRSTVPAGSAFLAEATAAESANALTNGEPRLVEVRKSGAERSGYDRQDAGRHLQERRPEEGAR
jgi:NADH-quinone oxidoreductase subunit G